MSALKFEVDSVGETHVQWEHKIGESLDGPRFYIDAYDYDITPALTPAQAVELAMPLLAFAKRYGVIP